MRLLLPNNSTGIRPSIVLFCRLFKILLLVFRSCAWTTIGVFIFSKKWRHQVDAAVSIIVYNRDLETKLKWYCAIDEYHAGDVMFELFRPMIEIPVKLWTRRE